MNARCAEIISEKLHPDLPIFALPLASERVLYTPGHVSITSAEMVAALRMRWSSGGNGPSGPTQELALRFEQLARTQEQIWLAALEAPFEPECLTVYLSNLCNSRCVYCFGAGAEGREDKDGHVRPPVIQSDAVRSASNLVAEICVRRGRPFSFVLHGGGEPSLHWSLAQNSWL